MAIEIHLSPNEHRQLVVRIRCHSSLRSWAEFWFDGEIVVDDDCPTDTVEVTPLGYAKNIKTTIGFQNPE
jgi:hypothetical protein